MMARGLGNVYLRYMRWENAEDFGHGGDLEGCADTDEEVAGLDVGRGEGGVWWTRRTEEGVVEFFGEWFAEEGYVRLIESVRDIRMSKEFSEEVGCEMQVKCGRGERYKVRG